MNVSEDSFEGFSKDSCNISYHSSLQIFTRITSIPSQKSSKHSSRNYSKDLSKHVCEDSFPISWGSPHEFVQTTLKECPREKLHRNFLREVLLIFTDKSSESCSSRSLCGDSSEHFPEDSTENFGKGSFKKFL